MAYANWIGIIMDRTACYADDSQLIKGSLFESILSYPYYAGGAIIPNLFPTMPEDNNMETYQGLRLTDRWYSVRLVDYSTKSTPRTGIAFGMVTVGYGFEGAAVETNMPVLIGDWAEQGEGDYWLRMGVIEFANYGKYTIRVSALSPGNFADRSFVVEVLNPELVLDSNLPSHTIIDSLGQRLQSIRANTALGGTPSTIQLDVGASAVNDFYNGNIIFISSGLGVGQARIITAYDGVTKIATIQPNWITNPGALSEYVIIPSSSTSVATIASAILDADLQTHLGIPVGGRNIGNILGQLAQSEFELRTNVFATVAVLAQGITAIMARRGVIQYQQVDMSYTKAWGAPDKTYYILYHYNAQQKQDIAKASLLPVW